MDEEEVDLIYRNRKPQMKFHSWPDKSLERFLEENHPGCKTAVEALKKLLKEKNIPQIERAPQVSEKEIAAKLKQVQDHIALKSDGVDLDKIPHGQRMTLAGMPLDSIENIRMWGFAWLEAIKKVQA